MASDRTRTIVLVVMGVSGVGKTTIGERLAARLAWPFYDADSFHADESIRKMNSGIPLEDTDRLPWLQRLNDLIARCLEEGTSAVLACSALKASYRDALARGHEDGVLFVYLSAPPEVVQERLSHRTGHFMNPRLLASQYSVLEEPPDALVVDAAPPPDAVVADVVQALQARSLA